MDSESRREPFSSTAKYLFAAAVLFFTILMIHATFVFPIYWRMTASFGGQLPPGAALVKSVSDQVLFVWTLPVFLFLFIAGVLALARRIRLDRTRLFAMYLVAALVLYIGLLEAYALQQIFFCGITVIDPYNTLWILSVVDYLIRFGILFVVFLYPILSYWKRGRIHHRLAGATLIVLLLLDILVFAAPGGFKCTPVNVPFWMGYLPPYS